MAVMLSLAAIVGYVIKKSPSTYLKSATVVFALPEEMNNASSQSLDISIRYSSLIATDDMMAQTLMSPQSQHLARSKGGTADYDFALLNVGDQEYPEYYYPTATLTVQSARLGAVTRTFTVVMRLLEQLLRERQAAAGVPPQSDVSISIAGEIGPISQQGSSKRIFGALILIAIIVASMVSGLLDRRGRVIAVLLLRGRRGFNPLGGATRPWRPMDASVNVEGKRAAKTSPQHRRRAIDDQDVR